MFPRLKKSLATPEINSKLRLNSQPEIDKGQSPQFKAEVTKVKTEIRKVNWKLPTETYEAQIAAIKSKPFIFSDVVMEHGCDGDNAAQGKDI